MRSPFLDAKVHCAHAKDLFGRRVPQQKFPVFISSDQPLIHAVQDGLKHARLHPQRLLRASQFRRPSRQFCFRLLALGHVSQDHGEQFLATRFDLGDGSLDLKFFTIGSQCPKRAQCSHAAAGNSGFAEAANMPGVLRTEPLRDETLNGLTHHIGG